MEELFIYVRSMVDFGLMVLIWLVQLIIYPGFEFSDRNAFLPWHRKYMGLVTFIVAPLMFFQLALILYQVFNNPHTLAFISLFLVAGVWVHTFIMAVPVHNRLNTDGNDKTLIRRLVKMNWIRTVIWTLLWFIGLSYWTF